MQLSTYLNRLLFTEEALPDIQTLFKLQRLHLMALPFENIDIQLNIPISLQQETIYRKVVENNRGGYCYELNTVFCELLKIVGFKAHLISGRITKGKNTGPEYDHIAVLVWVDNEYWLADVGYGDFSLIPLAIHNSAPQWDGRNHYRIRKENDSLFAVEKLKRDDKFHSEYLFTITPRSIEEFAAINYQKQTADDSHFTRNLICSLPTENGRITIINQRLIITSENKKEEIPIAKEALPQTLSQYFRINLPDEVSTNFRFHSFLDFMM